MRIEVHDGLASPQILSVTRLLVRDDYGQPLLVAIQTGPDELQVDWVGRPGDRKRFDAVLASLGVSKTAFETKSVSLGNQPVIAED